MQGDTLQVLIAMGCYMLIAVQLEPKHQPL